MTLKRHVALLVFELAKLTGRVFTWNPGHDPNLHFADADGATMYLEVSGERIILSIAGEKISGPEYHLDKLLKAIQAQYERDGIVYQKTVFVEKRNDSEKIEAFAKIAEKTVAEFRRRGS